MTSSFATTVAAERAGRVTVVLATPVFVTAVAAWRIGLVAPGVGETWLVSTPLYAWMTATAAMPFDFVTVTTEPGSVAIASRQQLTSPRPVANAADVVPPERFTAVQPLGQPGAAVPVACARKSSRRSCVRAVAGMVTLKVVPAVPVATVPAARRVAVVAGSIVYGSARCLSFRSSSSHQEPARFTVRHVAPFGVMSRPFASRIFTGRI